MAQELPTTYVPRSQDLQRLRDQLVEPTLGDPIPGVVLLAGAAGFGKSTLANAICHDAAVQTAFDDGIFWIYLGDDKPDIFGGLTALYAALVKGSVQFPSEAVAAYEVAQRIEKKNCLIVIDDAWRERDVEPFLRGGKGSTRIITTRYAGLWPDAKLVQVDEMTPAEARELLASRAEAPLRNDLEVFSRKLGNWPLLVALAGASIRRAIRNGDSIAGAFAYIRRLYDEKGAVGLDQKDATARKDVIGRSLETSLKFLGESARERYPSLAIFPPERVIPLSAIAALWQTTSTAARQTIEELSDLSLLRFDARSGLVRLHEVVHSWLAGQLKHPEAHYAHLLKGWGDPYSLPDDYAWRSIAYYMIRANRSGEVHELLSSYAWIRAKLEHTDLKAVIQDYDLLGEHDDLRSIQSALRLSAYVVTKDRTQLAGQLIGRLLTGKSAAVRKMVAEMEHLRTETWLRPLTAELTEPGGPLLLTLTGHTAEVNAVAVTPDGQYAVSGGGTIEFGSKAILDNTLRIWDLESGALLRELRGHTGEVCMVSLVQFREGLRIFSACTENRLCIWDFESGECLRQLEFPQSPIYAITPDGKRYLSSSGARLIERDLETHEQIRALEGHQQPITAVSLSPDGMKAISAAGNQHSSTEIIVWDLKTGAVMKQAKGPRNGCRALAMLEDGKKALAAPLSQETYVTLYDKVLKIWDLADCVVMFHTLSEYGSGK